jgi:hypothetical protein
VRLGFPLFFTRKRSLHVEQLFSRGGARCLIALEPAAIGSSALIATLIDYKVVALPSRSTSAPCDPQTCPTRFSAQPARFKTLCVALPTRCSLDRLATLTSLISGAQSFRAVTATSAISLLRCDGPQWRARSLLCASPGCSSLRDKEQVAHGLCRTTTDPTMRRGCWD